MLISESETEFQNLILKKTHLFELILECAEKQSLLNCAEKPVEYKNLMERRERFIKDINKTDVLINNFLEQYRSIPGNNDLESRMQLGQKKIDNIIKQILAVDETNKAKVTNEMYSVKNKIETIKNSKKGIFGYNSQNKITPYGAYTDSRR